MKTAKYQKDVKFYLEKRKDKKTGKLITSNVPILLFYSFGGQRLQFYTGYRIDAELWDEQNMKVKRNVEGGVEINKELGKLKTKVETIHDKAKALEIPLSIDYFKEKLKEDDAKLLQQTNSFIECHEEYIKECELTKGYGTMKGKKSTLNILKEFARHSGIKLKFENIDMNFYNAFLDYCFNKCEYNNNYTGTLIKRLKAFMNWATDRGYNTNLDFRKKSFRSMREEPEIIFLTWDELMKLKDFKFESESLSNVRDVFCFGCFTGMRFSDIAALSPENIHSDKILYRVVKTGEPNSIPLNVYSQAILKKHFHKKKLKSLPVISEQNTNEFLKDLAVLAGLKRKVQIVHFRGAKRISETKPLHEILTFHMSKKTFMTNFLAKGGSLLTAMSITGNKDLKTARRYYKVVDTLKQEEMKKVFG